MDTRLLEVYESVAKKLQEEGKGQPAQLFERLLIKQLAKGWVVNSWGVKWRGD